MKRIFQIAVLVLVVAFCFGQMALAAEHHFVAKQMPIPDAENRIHSNAAPAVGLHPEWAWFSGSPYQYYATPANGDGSPIWPCFGGGTAGNPDCPTIGSPAQPNYGLEVGDPFYGWPLKISGNDFCDGNALTDLPCGQVLGWFEDWNYTDATDDYLYIFTAQQGTAYIADTGTLDFGPISSTGPFSETILNDTNFGTAGTPTGPNNGQCLASFNYPLTSPAFPTSLGIYGVQAGKTCVEPVAGAATLTVINELGTPKYTKSTSATVCAPAGGPPCYTVKWTVAAKNKTTQKFIIWLY
jgi:hypothetical protein